VSKVIKNKKSPKSELDKKIPAIFLDRDGVINKEYVDQYYQNPLEINLGAISAVKRINKKGYLAVIITNQSAVAKGIISIAKLESDHRKLESYFLKKGAYFDKIYYCPYYPKKNYPGGLKKFLKSSNFRKPGNGMLIKAIKDLNIDKKKSFMIGDSSTDYYAAKKTGIRCLLVGKKFKQRGLKNYKSLLEATKSIL